MSAVGRTVRVRRGRQGGALHGIGFVLPALVLFVVFVGWPLVSGLYYSLYRWPGYGVAEFVGLQNFVNLAHDPDFYSAVKVTLVYTVVTTVLQTAIPMFLAIF